MAEQTRPARGMRDFLPDDVRRREYVVGVIERTYRRYGFEPLETPALENIETLTGKYGEEGNKLIFKVLRRGEHEASGETDLALRYDLTVPLARVVAEHRGKLPRFFKRYQIQPVWRADRPSRGRFREFYQCDVDAIGSTSPVVEAEVCAAVSDVLRELGFSDFVIRLNHRGLLRGCSRRSACRRDAARSGAGRGRQAGQDRARGRARRSSPRAASATRRAAERVRSRRPFAGRRRRVDDRWAREQVGERPGGAGGGRRARGDPRACAARRAPRAHVCSIRRSRAGCRTTPARSWRSPCRIWRAASAAAAATTG